MKTVVRKHVRRLRFRTVPVIQHSRMVKKSTYSEREKKLIQEELLREKQMHLMEADKQINEAWDTEALARRLRLGRKACMVKKSGIFSKKVPKEEVYYDQSLQHNVYVTPNKAKAARVYGSSPDKILVEGDGVYKVIG